MHHFCTLRMILKPGTYGSQGTSLAVTVMARSRDPEGARPRACPGRSLWERREGRRQT